MIARRFATLALAAATMAGALALSAAPASAHGPWHRHHGHWGGHHHHHHHGFWHHRHDGFYYGGPRRCFVNDWGRVVCYR